MIIFHFVELKNYMNQIIFELLRPNLVGRQVQVLIKLGTETLFFSPLWVTKNEVEAKLEL